MTDFGTQYGTYGRRTVNSKEVSPVEPDSSYQVTDFGTQFTVVTDFGADCEN